MSEVRNAVIMAAGMSHRFVPLAYETPKGLLKVKGQILIERQIEQLKEAGIHEITVIAGYMKEKFYYLKEKYGIDLVVNRDYFRYNNISSLMCVLDRISNTYICSSDNYFTENVFMDNCEQAYYAANYSKGKTMEWCMVIDSGDRIKRVEIGGCDSWYMQGHAYFTDKFSRRFKEILKREYYFDKIVRNELWETVYIRYIDELELFAKKYREGVIWEFDSLDDLRNFDENYRDHSGSAIMHMIAKQLNCREGEITDLVPVEAFGSVKCDFYFIYAGARYKYLYGSGSIERS